MMTTLREVLGGVSGILVSWVPFLVVLVLSTAVLVVARWLLFVKKATHFAVSSLSRQLTMLTLTAAAVFALVLALPIGDTSRGQLFSLFGIVLTGVIALSSTTFVGNAMAGLMLRAVHAFRAGDFLKTQTHFGRVTERGLLHTEIQTEDRDLTTLPNLFLVTNPVTVVRYSGTFVSATVSLGYDVPHAKAEDALVEAARAAELDEPFVQILELGDFAVQYRVAGFLGEVKYLLSARSRLRACMLDALHAAGIEIVSPAFMNQRQIAPGRRFIPVEPAGAEATPEGEYPVPEAIIFDKAELAESHEQLIEQLGKIDADLKVLREAGAETEGSSPEERERRIEQLKVRRRAVAAAIAEFERERAAQEAEATTPAQKTGP